MTLAGISILKSGGFRRFKATRKRGLSPREVQREGLNPIEALAIRASSKTSTSLKGCRALVVRADGCNLRLLALDGKLQGYLARGMLSTGHEVCSAC